MSEAERPRAEQLLTWLLQQPSGREFLWGLIDGCGVHSASMSAEWSDTAYMEGRRSVGLSLLRQAQDLAPELYAQMVREAADRFLAEELAARNKPSGGDPVSSP